MPGVRGAWSTGPSGAEDRIRCGRNKHGHHENDEPHENRQANETAGTNCKCIKPSLQVELSLLALSSTCLAISFIVRACGYFPMYLRVGRVDDARDWNCSADQVKRSAVADARLLGPETVGPKGPAPINRSGLGPTDQPVGDQRIDARAAGLRDVAFDRFRRGGTAAYLSATSVARWPTACDRGLDRSAVRAEPEIALPRGPGFRIVSPRHVWVPPVAQKQPRIDDFWEHALRSQTLNGSLVAVKNTFSRKT